MIQCEGQLSLMDLLAPTTNEFKPGDWIEAENVGEQLTFDEIAQMINQLITRQIRWEPRRYPEAIISPASMRIL